jgi:hypothetical protein
MITTSYNISTGKNQLLNVSKSLNVHEEIKFNDK